MLGSRPRSSARSSRTASPRPTSRRCASSSRPASRGTRIRTAGSSSAWAAAAARSSTARAGPRSARAFSRPRRRSRSRRARSAGPRSGWPWTSSTSEGNSLVGTGEVGELVCRQPFPGMTRGFWRDPERYLDAYWRRFPGVWVHGDWASVDEDGYWFLHGRSDDTLNIAGKRIGPAEIESAAVAHPAVAEAAAVGVPHEVKGEVAWVFCVARAAATSRATRSQPRSPSRPRPSWARPSSPTGSSSSRLSRRRAARRSSAGRCARKALGKDPGDLSSVENPEVTGGHCSRRLSTKARRPAATWTRATYGLPPRSTLAARARRRSRAGAPARLVARLGAGRRGLPRALRAARRRPRRGRSRYVAAAVGRCGLVAASLPAEAGANVVLYERDFTSAMLPLAAARAARRRAAPRSRSSGSPKAVDERTAARRRQPRAVRRTGACVDLDALKATGRPPLPRRDAGRRRDSRRPRRASTTSSPTPTSGCSRPRGLAFFYVRPERLAEIDALARGLEVALDPVRGLLRRCPSWRPTRAGSTSRSPGSRRRRHARASSSSRRSAPSASPSTTSASRARSPAELGLPEPQSPIVRVQVEDADEAAVERLQERGCRLLGAVRLDPLLVPPLQRRGGRRPRRSRRSGLRPLYAPTRDPVARPHPRSPSWQTPSACSSRRPSSTGCTSSVGSFVLAVIIFTVVFALMQPFLVSQFRRGNSAALGGVALIATLVSLIVTDLISDGFSIDGVGHVDRRDRDRLARGAPRGVHPSVPRPQEVPRRAARLGFRLSRRKPLESRACDSRSPRSNTVVGDLDGNRARIVERLEEAREAGADLVLFPELAVTGYPPEDLLLRPGFLRAAAESLETIARRDERDRRARRDAASRPRPLQRLRRLRGRRGEGDLPQAVPAQLRRLRRGPLLPGRARARPPALRRDAGRADGLRGHLAAGPAGDRPRARRRARRREHLGLAVPPRQGRGARGDARHAGARQLVLDRVRERRRRPGRADLRRAQPRPRRGRGDRRPRARVRGGTPRRGRRRDHRGQPAAPRRAAARARARAPRASRTRRSSTCPERDAEPGPVEPARRADPRRARADAPRARARPRATTWRRTASTTSSSASPAGSTRRSRPPSPPRRSARSASHCVSMPSRYSSAETRRTRKRVAEVSARTTSRFRSSRSSTAVERGARARVRGHGARGRRGERPGPRPRRCSSWRSRTSSAGSRSRPGTRASSRSATRRSTATWRAGSRSSRTSTRRTCSGWRGT